MPLIVDINFLSRSVLHLPQVTFFIPSVRPPYQGFVGQTGPRAQSRHAIAKAEALHGETIDLFRGSCGTTIEGEWSLYSQ
jgi:hypothetical protein